MAIPNKENARPIAPTGGGVGAFMETMIKDETMRPSMAIHNTYAP